MKVILVEDVKALGKKGEMVNVSDGYARNMLFPKKLALEASAKNINDLKLKKGKGTGKSFCKSRRRRKSIRFCFQQRNCRSCKSTAWI